MPKQYGVGVIGLGHWYSAYGLARSLQEYGKAELKAVAYHDEAKAKEYGTTFGVDWYTDYDALLARKDIHVVHICPPGAEIPGCTIKAAQAGKHIIVGKPMGLKIEQTDEMIKAVEKAGITCVYWPGMIVLGAAGLKKRLDNGLIGDIVVMHATGRWSIGEDWYCSGKAGWFSDPKQTPGGAMVDEGLGALGQLLWFAGSTLVQVECKTANLVHKDIGVEDWAFATFTFANGIIATLESSWTINSPQVTGPSPKPNSLMRMEIVGTRGEIIEDGLRTPGTAVLAAGAPFWSFERPVAMTYSGPLMPGPLDHLITCLETGRPPVANLQEGRRGFAACLAAYEAVRKGAPVKVSL